MTVSHWSGSRHKPWRYHAAAKMLALACATVLISSGCASSTSVDSVAVRDAKLTARVKSALVNDRALNALAISVTSHEGTVELIGTVNSPDQITRAVAIARSVDGVVALHTDLQLKSQ